MTRGQYFALCLIGGIAILAYITAVRLKIEPI